MSDPASLPASAGPSATASSQAPAPSLPWFLRALELLVARQSSMDTTGLPACDEAWLRARLAPFLAAHGTHVDAPLRKLLDDSLARLVREPLRAPMRLMHARFTPADLHSRPDGTLAPAEGIAQLHGPLVHDIASLVRDGTAAWEEDFVLDVTVRYWQRARAAGLPVDEDFGAFYRGVEWTGLLLQLARLGEDTALDADARARLLQAAHATASRYVELKALQRLLERIAGFTPPSGYAFGRV